MAVLELVVDDPCAIFESAERVCLSAGGFAALGLEVPADPSRPGARPQLLLTSGSAAAVVTAGAVLTGVDPTRAAIAMADPGRLFGDGRTSTSVDASTDPLAGGHLVEGLRLAGDVAVIAPHGGGIERDTDDQVDLLADTALALDTWTCSGTGSNQFRRLHITSDDLSERCFPGLATLLGRTHRIAVSFHGFGRVTRPGTTTALDVIVGGQFDLDVRYELADRIRGALPDDDGFQVLVATSCRDPLAGLSPVNVVNRLASSGGIQLEQSRRLRDSERARGAVVEAVAETLQAHMQL